MVKVVGQSLIAMILTASSMVGCSSYNIDINRLDHHVSRQKVIHHVGPITPEKLLSSFPVFKDNKDSDPYIFDVQDVATLANALEGKRLLVVFGTWCHDSQREVPRLLNLLQSVNATTIQPKFTLEMVAINQQKNSSEYINTYNIKRVPTILVLDSKGNEVSRITERPVSSLALDLAAK